MSFVSFAEGKLHNDIRLSVNLNFKILMVQMIQAIIRKTSNHQKLCFYIAQYLAYLIIRRIINTQLWSGRT